MNASLLLTASDLAATLREIVIRRRLTEIEQALKFDEDRERRRALRREYMDLTDPVLRP